MLSDAAATSQIYCCYASSAIVLQKNSRTRQSVVTRIAAAFFIRFFFFCIFFILERGTANGGRRDPRWCRRCCRRTPGVTAADLPTLRDPPRRPPPPHRPLRSRTRFGVTEMCSVQLYVWRRALTHVRRRRTRCRPASYNRVVVVVVAVE